MGSVQLVFGDMFDRPSDLIVLPCNIRGGVTRFVADKLRTYDIPSPRPRPRTLGSVDVMHFAAGEQVAQQVAFAASVHARGSDPAAIERIGRSLGEATTRDPFPQRVSAPLLGAGAGGLQSEIVVDALSAGFLSASSVEATLRIFTIHRAVYDRLLGHLESRPSERQPRHTGTEPIPPPDRAPTRPAVHATAEPIRVFISYASRTPGSKAWVRAVATFLRRNGINARCDIWHLLHGMNLKQWMVNEVEQADRVLPICTVEYARQAAGLEGGAGFEISQLLATMDPLNERRKVLPILWSENREEATPAFLRPYYTITFPTSGDDGQARRELLDALLNRQEPEPPLGQVPSRFV